MKIVVDSLTYNYKSFHVLKNVSFSVNSGEVLGIVGPNGSGKTTLVKCIAQILKPEQGNIYLNGTNASTLSPNEMAKMIGYVPQSVQNIFATTVMETVLLGRKPHLKWKIQQEDLDAVQKALDCMDINAIANVYMDQLSGGQKQIVHIARALAQEPQLLLFDDQRVTLILSTRGCA